MGYLLSRRVAHFIALVPLASCDLRPHFLHFDRGVASFPMSPCDTAGFSLSDPSGRRRPDAAIKRAHTNATRAKKKAGSARRCDKSSMPSRRRRCGPSAHRPACQARRRLHSTLRLILGAGRTMPPSVSDASYALVSGPRHALECR